MTGLLLAVAEEDVAAGPLGLLIVGILAVVTVLLVRNMSGRIKRLPPSFPEPPEQDGEDEEQPPAAR